MDFQKSANRIFSEDAQGKVIAEITFPDVDSTTVDINHTFVDDSLRGQGVAGQLMLAAIEQIRGQNKKGIVTCPYAVQWLEKHSSYSDTLSFDTDISSNK